MGAAILLMTATVVNVEFILGNLGNGFIAVANIMDWVKRRKLSAVDQLLTVLAISRITLLWSLYILKSTFSMVPNFEVAIPSTRLTNLVWIISNHFNIWLATILSIFYFLKIGNFSNSIFYYLRWRFKKVVLVALLVSLVLLFIDIFVTNIHINIWKDEFKANVSYSYKLKIFLQVSRLLVVTNTMFACVPFVVSMIMFFLLIFSLWKNLKMMKHIAQSSQNASTTAHINALKTVVAFLLLYIIFILSLFAHVWSYDFEEKKYFIFFCLVGMFALPSLHSYILILGNSKLRQISLLVLSLLKCKIQGCESLGPWHTRGDTFT
nr:putative taste receptor T2R14 [Rattus norvegicus]|eukprot:XP_002729479.1 PREDICTED: taste receptor type 2 member 125 [Rattus norvegicus]